MQILGPMNLQAGFRAEGPGLTHREIWRAWVRFNGSPKASWGHGVSIKLT